MKAYKYFKANLRNMKLKGYTALGEGHLKSRKAYGVLISRG
jgi:hypothetical protein